MDYNFLTIGLGGNETPEMDLTSCYPIPAYSYEFVLTQRIIVTFLSLLSMFGACLIIGTFVAFKELRTNARQILVQLSVADLLVAISHFLGVNFTLPKFTGTICSDYEILELNSSITSDTFCQVQGGMAVFSTVGSYFWTIALAYYLLVIVVFENRKLGKILLVLSYPFCWGFPGVLVFVLGFKHYLGFRPSLDASWCYLTDNHNRTRLEWNQGPEIASQIFVYLTYITLPIIYVWIRCSIKVKLKRMARQFSLSDKLAAKTKRADLKLAAIPIIFLVLKVWGTILGILYIYLHPVDRKKFSSTYYNAVLILVSSIGSTSQGFMNCLLFCIFHSEVRSRLLHCLASWSCCVCCRKRSTSEYLLQPSASLGASDARTDLEDTTQYGTEDALFYRDELIKKVAVNQTSIMSRNCDSSGRRLDGSLSTKSRLLSDSFNGLKYQSLSLGQAAGPE